MMPYRVTGVAMLGALVVLCLIFSAVPASASDDWTSTLTREPRGNFPDLSPLRATYAFSWSGITAATADIFFHRNERSNFVLEGKGRTVGLARLLWRFDVIYRSVVDSGAIRPLEVHQVENVRSKRIETNLTFSEDGVTSVRSESNHAKPSIKHFAVQNLYDLHSALLYLRSQPLRERSVFRIAVCPADSTYVATVAVLGREQIKVRTGTYNAIKLELHLERINKKDQLEPHRKFKRGLAWVSDDSDRLLLRLEGQVFVGTIVAEIQSVRRPQGDKA